MKVAQSFLYTVESPYEDGTNVARGTAFHIEQQARVLPWYTPAKSIAPLHWTEKWVTLRSRFERLIDECVAVECVLVQVRLPAAQQSLSFPPNVRVQTAILMCGGLRSEPARLYALDYSPLKAEFPIKSVKGEPIFNEAGKPAALRFGAWRRFVVQPTYGWSPESGSLPAPRLNELSRDGTNLLYQLPPEIAIHLWRNWPMGFSKTENSGESLWLDALFDLSWQQEPGGPLHAKRSAWMENCSYGLVGDGLFPVLPPFLSSKANTALAHESGYPSAYYSRIADVARASIAAIDVILEEAAKNSEPQALGRIGMKIPNSVIYVVGDVLGNWYYSHTKLDTLFGSSGFPGDPPNGNCVSKSQAWLRRANQEASDPLGLLSTALADFMNLNRQGDQRWQEGFQRINDVLGKNGLAFDLNGIEPLTTNGNETGQKNALAASATSVTNNSPQCSYPPRPDQLTQRTVILFLASNPDGVTKIALDQECRAIREKIRSSDFPRALELKTEWAVRSDDLLQYLNEYRPHIVHFSGHGSSSEELILHSESDQPKPISKAALRALFSALKDNIRVIILNACYSRPQAETITEIIDCAVGMNRAIEDQAAIKFAASFYRALGFGRSVQNAFDQGKAILMADGVLEENMPELLVRHGVDAKNMFLLPPDVRPPATP